MVFKKIASYDNFLVANMTLGMLEENGINCHLKDENIVTIDPLLNPAVGGIKLMVADVQYERAITILKDAETNYIQQIPCKICKNNTLVMEEKINKPTTFWGKLKNKIAYGQAETYQKLYRCTNCNNLFTELPLTT
jgi:Putative prokaryotic signal transducing protein